MLIDFRGYRGGKMADFSKISYGDTPKLGGFSKKKNSQRVILSIPAPCWSLVIKKSFFFMQD